MNFAKSLKERTKNVWEACYQHPFVQELGQGTLAKDKFQFYLVQDYKYLLEYAKVFALGALKAETEYLMTNFTLGQYAILQHEMDLHRQYMQEFGIKLSEAEQAKTALFNSAYTANMLNVGQKQGVAEIIAVILPCAWSYNDFAERLKQDYAQNLANNPYKSWLDMYTGAEYIDSFTWFFDALDALADGKSAAELAKLEAVFASSIEFEYLFWDMAYKKQLSF